MAHGARRPSGQIHGSPHCLKHRHTGALEVDCVLVPQRPTKNERFPRKSLVRRCRRCPIIGHLIVESTLPQQIVSDRDPRFMGNFWKALWRQLSTKLHLSTAYHPQTDGASERAIRTLEQILRAYVAYDQRDWAEHLPIVEYAYNSAQHARPKYHRSS